MAKKVKRPAKKVAKKAVSTVSRSGHRVVPLGDRVLIKPLDQKGEATTAAGIIIPGKDSNEKQEKGTVVAVGLGRVSGEGKRIAPDVKVGDKVWFKRGYDAEEMKVGGDELVLTSENNILAVEK